jgi:PAS domain S-box-containing protein
MWTIPSGTGWSCSSRANDQIQAIRVDDVEMPSSMSDDRSAAARPSSPGFHAGVVQLPMGTYVNAVGAEVRTVYVSPQLEAMLGWRLEDWSQVGFFESVIHADDRAAVMDRVAEFHRTGERFSVEYRLVARDGRVVWIHDETVVVRDETGKPAFLQGFVLDITEHRRSAATARGAARGRPRARRAHRRGRFDRRSVGRRRDVDGRRAAGAHRAHTRAPARTSGVGAPHPLGRHRRRGDRRRA